MAGAALAAPLAPVALGSADPFAVMAAATITNTGPSTITGDVGLSPGTAITGLTSLTLNGTVHAADAVAALAQTDLATAYNDAAGRTPAAVSPGDIGGMTLSPGVYKSGSSLGLTGTVTLDAGGDPNAVFIFQIGSTLITASASHVVLAGGAQSSNVFWQVGSSATLGTHSVFSGTIMALASITLTTGTTVDGRALARTAAVTMDTNTVGKVLPPGPPVPLAPVALGSADPFAVMAAATITNTGPSTITGDVGLSPGTAITGLTSLTLNGTVHAADAVAALAQTDLATAYNDAAGRTPDAVSPGDIGGMTLSPGVYKSGSSLGLTGTVTLDAGGDPNAVFIFQIGSTLITASASHVVLAGGAQSSNVFWQVGSSATLGTYSVFSGTIMALASITLTTGTTVDGRALARTAAVTMDTNTVGKVLPPGPPVPLAPVALGSADPFAVMAAATITNTGPSTITGDVGLSPGTAITGLTSLTLNGTVHAADAVAALAQTDLATAYNDAAGRTPDAVSPGDIGGMTLSPGVYKSGSSLGLTGTVTLDAGGDPNAVFIFQIGSTLITASASHVVLAGGAQSSNVFWQVGSSATLGTHSVFSGTIMALASITLTTGTTVDGRALARTAAVTMDTNTVG